MVDSSRHLLELAESDGVVPLEHHSSATLRPVSHDEVPVVSEKVLLTLIKNRDAPSRRSLRYGTLYLAVITDIVRIESVHIYIGASLRWRARVLEAPTAVIGRTAMRNPVDIATLRGQAMIAPSFASREARDPPTLGRDPETLAFLLPLGQSLMAAARTPGIVLPSAAAIPPDRPLAAHRGSTTECQSYVPSVMQTRDHLLCRRRSMAKS